MDYKDKIREILKDNTIPPEQRKKLEEILLAAEEYEDERIRKELLEHCKNQAEPYIQTGNKCPQIQSWITWLEKQCKQREDARWELLEKLLEADTIYQMAMNDAMVAEAKSKAISAISKLSIFDLLGVKKQGKPNPYSGVSFEYNGNIWGMCARDNGVDILLDKQLFTHLEKQDVSKVDGKIHNIYDSSKATNANKVEPPSFDEAQGTPIIKKCKEHKFENYGCK